jgi:hypothetical protein
MKKLVFILSVLALSTTSFAQYKGGGDGDVMPNVIKINPLGFLFGSASVGYERAINEKSSFVIAPTFGGFNFGGVKYSQFGGSAEYRFYLSKNSSAPKGFYAGPGANFSSGKVKLDGGDKTTFSSFGVKGIIGNQWVFGSGFVLDLNGGLQYSSFNYKDDSGIFSGLKGSGVFPALGFAIGYNF